MVLAFGAMLGPPESQQTVNKLSGIIAQCPLVHLKYPPSKFVRVIVNGLSRVLPGLPVPAPMPEDVSYTGCLVSMLTFIHGSVTAFLSRSLC